MFNLSSFEVFVGVAILIALVFLGFIAVRKHTAPAAAGNTAAPVDPPLSFWEKMAVFGGIAVISLLLLLVGPTQWHAATERERGEVRAPDGAGISGPVGMKGIVVKGPNGEIYLATGSDSQSVLHQAEAARKAFGGTTSDGPPGSWIEN